jgi:hypothetical protein
MEDDGGVLGNLPRSRPGTRSQKRTAGKPGGPAKRPRATARRAAARAEERRGTKSARSRAPAGPDPASQATAEDDPMGEAVRLATQVPLLGVRVAAGVTRELLRRLPRP